MTVQPSGSGVARFNAAGARAVALQTRELGSDHLDRFVGDGQIDFVDQPAQPLPITLIGRCRPVDTMEDN